MEILDINKLTLRFGGLVAVNQVDLAIEKEKIFAIIGPNGAGKTTVFNVVTGIYEPDQGKILLHGHEVRRQMSWKITLVCVAIGIITAICSVLVSRNIDRMWKVVVRQNFIDSTKPFLLHNAWSDFLSYMFWSLCLDKRGSVWRVTTPDLQYPLAIAQDEQQARMKLDHVRELVGLYPNITLEKRGDNWIALSTDQRILETFSSEDEAKKRIDDIKRVRNIMNKDLALTWIVFILALLVGSSGAFVVWHRSRRTPNVIAEGGIARTFQNIRLFQDMTVLENVLVGMDHKLQSSTWQMIFRTPGLRREEEQARAKALALLDFVGLKDRANQIAKNLPYGDQRRLEIARALATEPRLLLLDEPAAGMNPAEANELMQLIRRIRDRGITILLIEHHMKVVMGISDRIAVLDYGSKIAEGTPEEVRSNPRVIEAYLGKEEFA